MPVQLPILRTTENAFAALLSTASLGCQVLTGIDNLDKTAPVVICYAEDAKEDFPFSGIYRLSMNVVVKEMAADTNTTSSLATTVFANVLNNQTKAALNTYPGFFCYEYFIDNTMDNWSGDAWEQHYKLEVVSALS